jgi:quercetin dioxygenase-like cupin family protein
MAEAEVRLIDIAEIEQQVFTRSDISGHQVTRHVLSKELTGMDNLVADYLTFPPGFVHHMHLHPYADIVMIPFSGCFQFLGESGEPVDVSPGQILVIPRGKWHEARNVGTVDSHVLHLFSGVGSAEDAGFEAYDGQTGASGSMRHTKGSRGCG